MFASSTILFSLILPALALVAPRQSLQGRAGAAIGDVFAGAPISSINVKAENVVQCGTAYISWTGATDPVSLFIALGGLYVGETPITTLNNLWGGSTTWQVNQPAGKTLEFRVTDAKGAVAYVQNVKIGAGDGWCLEDGAASAYASALDSATATTWTPPAESTWKEETSQAWTAQPTTSTQEWAAAEVTPSTTTTKKASTTSTTVKTSATPTSSSIKSTTPTTSLANSTISTIPSSTSSTSLASIAGAVASASTSSRSGASSRSMVGGSGILAVLVTGATMLGLSL